MIHLVALLDLLFPAILTGLSGYMAKSSWTDRSWGMRVFIASAILGVASFCLLICNAVLWSGVIKVWAHAEIMLTLRIIFQYTILGGIAYALVAVYYTWFK